MAARLVARGCLRDPLWRAAFEATPRHLLVPEADRLRIGGRVSSRWWDSVYDEAPARPVIAPSQPTPAVLAWLLELLIPAGHTAPDGGPVRVLELGAGRGYATALLCHRVGAEQVTATDPTDTFPARHALAQLGLFPSLVDAADPLATSTYGPYDAVLRATGDTWRPEASWLSLIAAGGRMVTAVRDPQGDVAALVYERSESGRRVRSRMVTRDTDPVSTTVSSTQTGAEAGACSGAGAR